MLLLEYEFLCKFEFFFFEKNEICFILGCSVFFTDCKKIRSLGEGLKGLLNRNAEIETKRYLFDVILHITRL